MNYNLEIIHEDCKILFDRIKEKINPLREKSILVTGANGLLGGFLSDFLCYLNDNHDFRIKITLTSLSEKNKAERIKHLIQRHDVTYKSFDFSNDVKEEFGKDMDYIFFMSGYGQPKKFIENKMKTINVNTVGLHSLLKSIENKECNFLFASTSEVYGDPDIKNIPTKETYNGDYSVESNRACYISSKRLGEVICLEYSKDRPKLKMSIARIALSYGPGVLTSDDRVLQDFLIRGKSSGKIDLFDDGSAIRNYIYITDCMEMLLNIIIENKKIIYNVGGDTEEVTIFELANIVGKTLNIEVEKGRKIITHTSKSPSRVALDVSRYKEEFGEINSKVLLSEGIKKTAKWLNLI